MKDRIFKYIGANYVSGARSKSSNRNKTIRTPEHCYTQTYWINHCHHLLGYRDLWVAIMTQDTGILLWKRARTLSKVTSQSSWLSARTRCIPTNTTFTTFLETTGSFTKYMLRLALSCPSRKLASRLDRMGTQRHWRSSTDCFTRRLTKAQLYSRGPISQYNYLPHCCDNRLLPIERTKNHVAQQCTMQCAVCNGREHHMALLTSHEKWVSLCSTSTERNPLRPPISVSTHKQCDRKCCRVGGSCA